MADWNPEQYARFREQRRRPFLDLLDLLPPGVGGSWIDLGCGDGALTRLAAERLGATEVVGVDASPAMLAEVGDDPDDARASYTWRQADLTDVLGEGETYDLVLCNAVMQFVPDHPTTFPRMLEAVAPGGWVAVHMPYNHIARSHLLMEAAATSDDLKADFEGFKHAWPQERPEVYVRMLQDAGFEHALVQLRTYRHALPGVGAIVDWMRSGGLRPWLEALPEGRRAAFVDKYTRLMDHAYPALDDDVRLLDYTRLLIVGHRPSA